MLISRCYHFQTMLVHVPPVTYSMCTAGYYQFAKTPVQDVAPRIEIRQNCGANYIAAGGNDLHKARALPYYQQHRAHCFYAVRGWRCLYPNNDSRCYRNPSMTNGGVGDYPLSLFPRGVLLTVVGPDSTWAYTLDHLLSDCSQPTKRVKR